MNISFEGRVALVTGAASGLGLATAKAFAESGASVALADWNENAARAAADELTAQGRKAIAIRCDVSDDAQVEAMVKQTVATFGHLDAAYNNAASRMSLRRRPTPLERITIASWGSISAANGAA
jgi:NAD(P)-dependent dehydrogenase (short-subunit alcohol dehydrogenase family)